MFKENFSQFNKKEEKIEKKSDFLVESFQEAIENRSLIGYLMAKNKEEYLESHNFSDFEKSLVSDEKTPNVSLMIDIDGVLIDTEGELKKIYDIMTSDFNILKNSANVSNLAKNSKIPFSVLKTLLKARDQASEVHLITDRLGQGPCYFPCFGKEKRKTLNEHGINLKTNAFKMFLNGDGFLPMIEKSDIVYYIGSSTSDRTYADRIRKSMNNRQEPIPEEKLQYLEIAPVGREKNIL